MTLYYIYSSDMLLSMSVYSITDNYHLHLYMYCTCTVHAIHVYNFLGLVSPRMMKYCMSKKYPKGIEDVEIMSIKWAHCLTSSSCLSGRIRCLTARVMPTKFPTTPDTAPWITWLASSIELLPLMVAILLSPGLVPEPLGETDFPVIEVVDSSVMGLGFPFSHCLFLL